MLESIRLQCPLCKEVFTYSVPYIEGQMKAMKIGKVGEVAQQLKEKRGPFYDRWLAAMDLRGEQKRCRDCKSYLQGHDWMIQYGTNCKGLGYTGGMFACKVFRSLDESD